MKVGDGKNDQRQMDKYPLHRTGATGYNGTGKGTQYVGCGVFSLPRSKGKEGEGEMSVKIVTLPCDIGDNIYYIDRYTGEIDIDTVKYFTITKDGVKPILIRHNIRFWNYYQWGENVFLTKEEAEQSLRTPQNDEVRE